jgi:hypothetical protein
MEAVFDFNAKTGGAPIVAKVEETFTNSAVDRAALSMK